jgi:uncharacterized protein (TIGR02996 family)
MSEEAAFLEVIARNPADKTARLVFADWLQERGDPRAPWVRDDELWEWMKPRAKDPTGDLVAATARSGEGHKTVDALARLGPSVLPKVFAHLSKGVPGKAHLYRVLELLGPSAEPWLALLLKEIRNEKWDAQFGAYKCLMRLAPHNEKAMEVVRASATHPDRAIRQLAIATLTALGAHEGAPEQTRETGRQVLHELVRSGTEDQAADALRALAESGGLDESLIPDLVRRIADADRETHPQGNSARQAAITALARLGEPGARGLLAAAAHFTNDSWVTDAFKKIGAAAVLPLREALTSPNDKVRQLATVMLAEQLGRAPDPELLPEIVSALSALFRAPPAEYHPPARNVLDRLGPAAQAAVVLPLREVLTSPNDKVRQLATVLLAEQLGRAPDPELLPVIVPALSALFRAPEGEYHRSARDAVLRLGPAAQAVAPALLECVERGDEFMRDYRETFSALGTSASAVVPTLLRAVEALRFDRARSYGEDLGKLGHGRAVLLHALRRPGPNMLSEVREILSRVSLAGLKELDEVLRKELDSGTDHGRCREPARLALESAPDEAAGALTPFLSDKSKVTRLVALHALWYLDSAASVPGILLALRDKDKTVRITALRALGQLGTGTAGVEDAVRAMLTDRANDVRDVALEVLVKFEPRSG